MPKFDTHVVYICQIKDIVKPQKTLIFVVEKNNLKNTFNMEQFTNLYQVSKTLRFELIPDKRTKVILEQSDLIAQDEHRAKSYKLVKKIIDRYHKNYIESVLETLRLPYNTLDELYNLYCKSQKTDTDKKALEKVQDKLRKLIADALTKDNRYKRIDKKELIREDILSVITPEERVLVDEFRDFTTYFTGFHENRKNMYSPRPNPLQSPTVLFMRTFPSSSIISLILTRLRLLLSPMNFLVFTKRCPSTLM